MSTTRQTDMSFVSLMLLIIAINSCVAATQPSLLKQLEHIEGMLNKINDKLDRLPDVGPHP